MVDGFTYSSKKFKLDDDIIRYNPAEFVDYTLFVLTHYSGKGLFAFRDIKIYHIEPEFIEQSTPLMCMMKNKSPVMDTLFYFQLLPADRPKIVKLPAGNELREIEEHFSMTNLIHCVHLMYGLFLIRGNLLELLPENKGELPRIFRSQNPFMTKAVIRVMMTQLNLLDSGHEVVLSMQNYSFLSTSLISRLLKGIAGYRTLNAVAQGVTEAKMRTLSPDLCKKVQAIKSFRAKGIYKELHPEFPSDCAFKRAIPSLSKACENLLVDIFDQKELEGLVARKILFKVPVKDENISHNVLTEENFNKAVNKMVFDRVDINVIPNVVVSSEIDLPTAQASMDRPLTSNTPNQPKK